MDDLQGLHIIVTRPQAQAEPWSKRLSALGAQVSCIPLLDIVALQDAAHVQAIKNRILNIDLYNKVIFVSQNALKYGLDWLDTYWPQLPTGVNFFAIGEATAKLMLKQGIAVTDLAQTQGGAMTSEVFLQSPALKQIAGEKILIMRGLGGRTFLGEALTERGAKVDYCELYERQLPSAAASQFAQLLTTQTRRKQTSLNNSKSKIRSDFNAAGADVLAVIVTLHSGEALENLLKVLKPLTRAKNTEMEKQSYMQQLILLVPSERVTEQAIDAGFTTIFTAENATESSMLQRLLDIRASLDN